MTQLGAYWKILISRMTIQEFVSLRLNSMKNPDGNDHKHPVHIWRYMTRIQTFLPKAHRMLNSAEVVKTSTTWDSIETPPVSHQNYKLLLLTKDSSLAFLFVALLCCCIVALLSASSMVTLSINTETAMTPNQNWPAEWHVYTLPPSFQ